MRNESLKWFSDYLDGRSQAVITNGIVQFFNHINGSTAGLKLGPLLFLLFVNDFPSCLECTKCNLFADDTAIYCNGSSMDKITETLQVDIQNVVK